MGLGKLIIGTLSKSTKALTKIETKVDEAIAKLKSGCPIPKELVALIKRKNTLLKGVSQVLKMLDVLSTIGKGVTTSITAIQGATTVIKVLPVPTSYPPGVGIPMGVINTLSDLLDTLADKTKTAKGIVGAISPAIELIKALVGSLQQKFNVLDTLLVNCLNEADLSPEEKAALTAELNVSQDSSSIVENVANTKTLEDSLTPNSNNPYTYKGWTFIIDKDIKNTKSFPRRRIIATKNTQKLLGEFSFSSSTDVLVDEMKFRIDNRGQTPKYYIGETIVE